MQTFFDVSNEIFPPLVIRFLVTNYKTFEKIFGGLSKSTNEKEKEKKKRMGIAKLFVLHPNATNRKSRKTFRQFIEISEFGCIVKKCAKISQEDSCLLEE